MKGEHVTFEKSGKTAATFWEKAQPIEGRNPTDEANRKKLAEMKRAKARFERERELANIIVNIMKGE
jgi:hypothetical protein